MLPDSQALGIAQNRTFHVKGRPLPESIVTWTWWIASGDHLCSNFAPNEPLAPFIASDAPDEMAVPTFSSLTMFINAHYKLDLFMRHHGASATPRIQKFAQLMSDLVLFPRYYLCLMSSIMSRCMQRLHERIVLMMQRTGPHHTVEMSLLWRLQTPRIQMAGLTQNFAWFERADTAMMLFGTRRK